jgi:UDP-3-O-[3-hydroxymyristoyl] N-acetylglucosamine deacetylase
MTDRARAVLEPTAGNPNGITLRRGDHALPCGPQLATGARGTLATDVPGFGRTTEHWLAALVGTGRAGIVELRTGDELPAMEGSCSALAMALHGSRLPSLRRWCPPRAVTVGHGDRRAQWLPGPDGVLSISYALDFDNPMIGVQSLDVELDPSTFVREIASARTFTVAASMQEVEAGRDSGIGAGLGEGHALVAGPEGWLHGVPRWPDEPVRHKILDLLGDLGLLGIRPAGRVLVRKGGHELHRQLVRAAAIFMD